MGGAFGVRTCFASLGLEGRPFVDGLARVMVHQDPEIRELCMFTLHPSAYSE